MGYIFYNTITWIDIYMFIIDNISPAKKCINYPKYIVIKKSDCVDPDINNIFYYLIIPKTKFYYNVLGFPVYIVTEYLSFNLSINNDKFDLSRLGMDYVVNGMCIHYRSECIGSYPDNYVFMTEPRWPSSLENLTDRSPLKRTYL